MASPEAASAARRQPRLPALLVNAWLTRRRPISLVHFVTERCNARCAHCFLDFSVPDDGRRELTLQEIEQTARQLDGALLNVNLTGGEPFLRQDLWPICRAYFTLGGVASIYISSNGSLPERLRALLDSYASSGLRRQIRLSISIDDFAAGHDANRRLERLFGLALESYRCCREYRAAGVEPNINLTVTTANHGRVLDLYRHLRDVHGVTAFTATALRETGVTASLSAQDRHNIATAYGELTELIAADRHAGKTGGFGGGLIGHLLNAKNDQLTALLRRSYVGQGQGHPACPAGGLFAVIRADGAVHACEMRDDVALGNLRDQGYRLKAILQSAVAEDVRHAIRERRCHCTYECALGIGLISHPRYAPVLALGALRSLRHAR